VLGVTLTDSQQILSFYIGNNTPERKDYIMENLVMTGRSEKYFSSSVGTDGGTD